MLLVNLKFNQSINWRASFIRSAPADHLKGHYGDSPELHPSHTLWGTLIELGWFPLIWCYFRNFVLLIFPGVVLVSWEDWTGPGGQTLRVVTCRSQRKSSHSVEKRKKKKKEKLRLEVHMALTQRVLEGFSSSWT